MGAKSLGELGTCQCLCTSLNQACASLLPLGHCNISQTQPSPPLGMAAFLYGSKGLLTATALARVSTPTLDLETGIYLPSLCMAMFSTKDIWATQAFSDFSCSFSPFLCSPRGCTLSIEAPCLYCIRRNRHKPRELSHIKNQCVILRGKSLHGTTQNSVTISAKAKSGH